MHHCTSLYCAELRVVIRNAQLVKLYLYIHKTTFNKMFYKWVEMRFITFWGCVLLLHFVHSYKSCQKCLAPISDEFDRLLKLRIHISLFISKLDLIYVFTLLGRFLSWSYSDWVFIRIWKSITFHINYFPKISVGNSENRHQYWMISSH